MEECKCFNHVVPVYETKAYLQKDGTNDYSTKFSPPECAMVSEGCMFEWNYWLTMRDTALEVDPNHFEIDNNGTLTIHQSMLEFAETAISH